MLYLQQVLVILWTIWTHKNLVVHEGKLPNLMKVTQSLTCRYIEAYFDCSSPSHDNTNHVRLRNIPGKPWNLIIKVAGARMKRLNRSGFTFKAKNLQGNVILQGVSSYTGRLFHSSSRKQCWKQLCGLRSLVVTTFCSLVIVSKSYKLLTENGLQPGKRGAY